MQTWVDAEERAEFEWKKIVALHSKFAVFRAELGQAEDVVILDINKMRRKKSLHLEHVAVDFCFSRNWPICENSEFVRAAYLAGFRGAGVYYGKNKRSYHVDLAERVALWTARRGKNGKWVYRYYNLEGNRRGSV